MKLARIGAVGQEKPAIYENGEYFLKITLERYNEKINCNITVNKFFNSNFC